MKHPSFAIVCIFAISCIFAFSASAQTGDFATTTSARGTALFHPTDTVRTPVATKEHPRPSDDAAPYYSDFSDIEGNTEALLAIQVCPASFTELMQVPGSQSYLLFGLLGLMGFGLVLFALAQKTSKNE